MSANGPRGTFFAIYLMLTAVLCGAAVMIIEVLGSRVIGPFFGVSLFVWTALITVALVALAIGYALGGWLADRHGSAAWLYALIGAAGAATMVIPILRVPLIQACVPLGLRMGSLAASALLFGPALLLLGCVSPYVVRIALRRIEQIGRTVGRLYALSTIGSFAGTVLTGFYLIGQFGVDRILVLTGATLLLLSIGYFAVSFGWRVLPAALIAVALASGAWPRGPTALQRTLADGTTVTLVDRRESFYGQIKVVDYRFGPRHTREMIIDGLVQTGIDMSNGESIYEYSHVLGILARSAHRDGVSALIVGLGAGAISNWLATQGVRSDIVEIDPRVVEVAQQHFGFRATGQVVVEDARRFLDSTRTNYDYIVMDAFTGDSSPTHLLSLEALRLIQARLTAEGVALFNFHGSIGADNRMTLSFLKTLRVAFPQVDVYPAFDRTAGETWGNIVFVARKTRGGPIDTSQLAAAPMHALVRTHVRAAIAAPLDLNPGADAIVLTDDYNPIDLVDLALKERVRKSVLATTHWDLLLR